MPAHGLKTPRITHHTVILLIEDDQSIREILGEMLGSEGYEVVTAENGQVGLEKLQTLTQACLVLLDLNMPIMDGWQFLEAKQALAVLRDVPVVVLSAVASSSRPIPGALRQLSKPIELETLFGILREHAA